MTSPGRRVTVYLPAHIADIVESQGKGNQSRYLAEAVQTLERRRATLAMLREAGYLVTAEGVQRMRERVQALEARRASRG
ncbi:hypothetical protein [Catellatospora vulcania]|uniref:hypothetical protein n=1 Tax=Catellatospora vulcania TaxID=1460450 RepID=UPI0012D4AD75|nr:hypothetical protein [Catellatospora vulcania]